MSTALLDLSNSFANAVERAGRSAVSANEGGRAGVSGTIWRDGLVVTAEHTIRCEQELTTELPTGASAAATVIGRDATTDVALLRVKDPLPATAEFADAAQLRVGHFVLAIGRRGKNGLAASDGARRDEQFRRADGSCSSTSQTIRETEGASAAARIRGSSL
jgi:S1-C subfamily serine protease